MSLLATSAVGSPDLIPIGLQVPATVRDAAQPTVTISWGVTNQGSSEATLHWDGIYITTNTNPVINATDSSIWSWLIPYPLEPTQFAWSTNTIHLPIEASGDYYIILKTDSYDQVAESDEDNNTIVSHLRYECDPPDLGVLYFQAPPGSYIGPPKPEFTLIWAVTNLGPATASGDWVDALWLSRTPNHTTESIRVDLFQESGSLPSGEVYWRTNTIQMPITNSGSYYLIFETGGFGALRETNVSNNTFVAPITFTILPPDLKPLSLRVSTNFIMSANPGLTIVWGVTNQGIGPAVAPWLDGVYLSADAVLDYGIRDELVAHNYETKSLPPGGFYWRTNFVPIPITRSGTNYLVFQTDSDVEVARYIFESDYGNNVVVLPVTSSIAGSGPQIGPGHLAEDGSFEIWVYGSTGTNYTLQFSVDLVNWRNGSSFVCTNYPTRVQDRFPNSTKRRFYRVVQ